MEIITPILLLSFIAYIIYSEKKEREAKDAPNYKMRNTFSSLKDLISEKHPITTPYNNYLNSHFTKGNKTHIIEVSGVNSSLYYEPFIRFKWIVKVNNTELICITEKFNTNTKSAVDIFNFMKNEVEKS
jgi:hypothetical protein